MQRLNISTISMPYNSHQHIEIVERKGIGHPDTICDALAEELSRSLCQYYLDKFDMVMHHNVDKALLWGGASQPAFNGGEIIAPMEIFLAGRAICEYKGIKVPLMDLVEHSCSTWLTKHLHALDVARDVKFHSLIRPGSSDLVELYLRQEETGIALANDTSCGVGYAPLSELEQIALQVEKFLNSAEIKLSNPEIGEDIKVMGVQRENVIDLTIACAFVDRYISDITDYASKKDNLVILAKSIARKLTNKSLHITVNSADDIANQSIYLTVTGTSAESGDDGEVGRGNRVNGLITPYRPMNMEAAAGKNPVTHVGKLYNIVAQQIAIMLVNELDEVKEAYCYLVSQIGSPVNEPKVIDLRLNVHNDKITDSLQKKIEAIVNDNLSSMHHIRQELIYGSMQVY